MKNSKAILFAIFASVFAVLTVVNMSLASPKSAGENTLDMLEIMTRAFDESEGGEGPGHKVTYPCADADYFWTQYTEGADFERVCAASMCGRRYFFIDYGWFNCTVFYPPAN